MKTSKQPFPWRRCAALLLMILTLTGCAAHHPSPEASAPPEVSASPAIEKKTGVGFYFNTVVTLTLYGTPQVPEGLIDEIWADCARYESLLSKTVEGSDVDRINKAGGKTVTVDAETWEILRRAKEISEMTGQAFCVTIAPLTALWDFVGGTQRMPSEAELKAALPLVDDEKLQLGDGYTVTLPAGMEIDLGGIAKGYIADKVAEHIRGRVSGATLSFGGNVYALGQKPDGSPFNIGIQDPDDQTGQAMAVIAVTDISVVTSGIYERYFDKDGVRYHHILDPKTGISAQSDLSSATIVCESSMTADALATACIVLGREKATALLEANGYDGVLIGRDRTMTTTAGFEDKYPLRLLDSAPAN